MQHATLHYYEACTKTLIVMNSLHPNTGIQVNVTNCMTTDKEHDLLYINIDVTAYDMGVKYKLC